MANREDLAIIRAARAGQPQAQLTLGKRYLTGGNGLPQSLQASGIAGRESWMGLFSSHPSIESRIASLQNRARA